jgi:hypothetical protein
MHQSTSRAPALLLLIVASAIATSGCLRKISNRTSRSEALTDQRPGQGSEQGPIVAASCRYTADSVKILDRTTDTTGTAPNLSTARYPRDLAIVDRNTQFALWLNVGGTNVSSYIRKTSDGGVTWATVDTFAPAGNEFYGNSIAFDSVNRILYYTGQNAVFTTTLDSTATTRISRDLGQTWRTVDGTFDGTTGRAANFSPSAIATGPSGEVYVLGIEPSVPARPKLRRSLDQGATWADVPSYTYNEDVGSYSQQEIVITAAGHILTLAVTGGGTTLPTLILRKSVDGGATWANTTLAARSSFSKLSQIAGKLYLTYIAPAADNYPATGGVPVSWYLQSSSDGGASWQTLDTGQVSNGNYSVITDTVGVPGGFAFLPRMLEVGSPYKSIVRVGDLAKGFQSQIELPNEITDVLRADPAGNLYTLSRPAYREGVIKQYPCTR